MMRSKKIKKESLDSEEAELLSSFENDEWKSVKNVAKEKKQARTMAAKTLINQGC